MPPDLLHVVGYLTGAALYAMLLFMALQDATGDRLTVGAAVLGLAWNAGELLAYGARVLPWSAAEPWLAAASFAALGGLAAVVIHSVARGTRDEASRQSSAARALTMLAYVSAAVAGVMQFASAARGAEVPDPTALLLLTSVLVVLAPFLVLATRRQANLRRAIWMTALAVFAISALHVGNFHGPRESWATELLGHHASIPLAFAILYQDYRFALADLFLKQALSLVLVVALVFGLWSIAGPALAADPGSPRAIGLLLALWVLSSFLFPVIRHTVTRFVDRVVLMRPNYQALLDEITTAVQNAATEEDVLERTCRALAPALTADGVTWGPQSETVPHAGVSDVAVTTAEAPAYTLTVGRLAGGRRLLSDDVTMLERAASLAGRRIDTLRFTRERYERILREREMHSLATEAELKALRAQINPHFLFNALTTIGYLIQEAPGRAVETLLRLTRLLRGALRTDGELTTLAREAEIIECYLEIERERFEDRLQVALQIPDTLGDAAIPPLIVQPLVENAIKHGIAGARRGGHVTVHASLAEPGVLSVQVRNTGAPLQGRLPGPDGGVGLRNVEQRLATHYGAAGTLTLTHAGGETVAEIRLPLTHATSDVVRMKARARA